MKVINRAFRKLVPKLREKGFYKSQKKRSINWKEYTLSQITEVKILDKITFLVDSFSLKETKSFGRPATNPKDLVKAILVAELLGLPERQAQGWINFLASKVNITSYLDDRTIGRAYSRLRVLEILKQVFEKTKTSDGRLMGMVLDSKLRENKIMKLRRRKQKIISFRLLILERSFRPLKSTIKNARQCIL